MSDISDVHAASPEVDPFELIREISNAIDYGEIAHDPYAFVKARKLLNNDLVEAIHRYTAINQMNTRRNLLWELSHHPVVE